MANVVGDIAIQVGADIAPLLTNLGKAQGAVSGFGREADAAASGPMRRMAVVAGTIAGAAAAAALGLAAMTKAAIDNIGAINDAAKATGLHVSALQAMQQVAGEAGVEADGLTKSIIKMQDAIASAAKGSKAQADALSGIGLSVAYLAELSPDEQFAQIADAISAIEDPASRAAAAIDVFGRSGADLIPMMDGYRASLADAIQYQQQFGIALTDEGAAAVDQIGDSLGRLTGTLQGVGYTLATTFAPEIQANINAIAGALEWASEAAVSFHDAFYGNPTSNALQEISAAASDAVGSIAQAAMGLQGMADGNITTALNAHAVAIRDATEGLQEGRISAAEYREQVMLAFQGVISVYQTVEQIDGTDMSGAIEGMNNFAKALGGPLDMLLSIVAAQQEVAATAPAAAAPGLVLGAQGFGGRPEGLEGTNKGSVGFARNRISAFSAGSGGGGGGGGGNDLTGDLKALQESLATETEAADAAYAERLQKLTEFRDAKLITEAEYNDLELRAKREHDDALAEIDAQTRANRLSGLSGMFGDLASLMQSSNKRTFEIGKAASIAGAVIDGYESATAAWKKGMKVGGPGVAAAFTAASLARTGVMISNIRSTQIGGGGTASGGGSVSGGATAAQAPMQVSLTGLNASDLFSGNVISGLLDKLNAEAGDRGYKIVGFA